MTEVWNLQGMYTGFDDPQFAGDLAEFKGIVQSAQTFAGQLKDMQPLEGLRRGIALLCRRKDSLAAVAALARGDHAENRFGMCLGRPLGIADQGNR